MSLHLVAWMNLRWLNNQQQKHIFFPHFRVDLIRPTSTFTSLVPVYQPKSRHVSEFSQAQCLANDFRRNFLDSVAVLRPAARVAVLKDRRVDSRSPSAILKTSTNSHSWVSTFPKNTKKTKKTKNRGSFVSGLSVSAALQAAALLCGERLLVAVVGTASACSCQGERCVESWLCWGFCFEILFSFLKFIVICILLVYFAMYLFFTILLCILWCILPCLAKCCYDLQWFIYSFSSLFYFLFNDMNTQSCNDVRFSWWSNGVVEKYSESIYDEETSHQTLENPVKFWSSKNSSLS